MNYAEKYLSIAKDIVLKHVPKEDYAVFLFGSRAAGNSHRYSDIDIGFLGEKKLSPVIKSDIEYELEESIVPYHIDLIDFSTVSEDFKKIALEHIEWWNKPEHIKVS